MLAEPWLGGLEMTIDAAARARLFRRVSWRILPLVGLAYLAALVDRLNIGFAALQMNTDLGFSAAVYGVGASALFLTYALLEVPANMLMLRVGPKRWIIRILVTWGLLSAAMALVREPWQFYGLRMLIGAAEAGFFPTAIYYVSTWFPAEQRGWAISRFYVALPLSSLLMGGLAAALLGLDGVAGLRGWQWLFVLEGLPSVAIGAALWFLLPESPASARWLTPEEAAWLTAQARAQPEPHGFRALFAMLMDRKVLIFGVALMTTILITNVVNLSTPSILKERAGLSTGQIGAVVSAGGLLGLVLMPLGGWVLDRFAQRFGILSAAALGMAICVAILAKAPTPTLIVGGYLVYIAFNMFVQGLQPPLATRYMHGAKLGMAYAGINTIAQMGPVVGPALLGQLRTATGDYALGLLLGALAPLTLAILAPFMPRLLGLERHAAAPRAQAARAA